MIRVGVINRCSSELAFFAPDDWSVIVFHLHLVVKRDSSTRMIGLWDDGALHVRFIRWVRADLQLTAHTNEISVPRT